MERLYIDHIRLDGAVPRDCYLARLPAVAHLAAGHRLRFTRPVTFLVGDNGTGKSTLMEAMAVACGFNAEGGTRNYNFATQETHSPLYRYLTVSRSAYPKDGFFLRAESFYNAASYVDALDEETLMGPRLVNAYGGRSLHRQSHGESFMALVQNRFGGRGLYLLDEPEAALSPARQLTLLAELHALVRKDSQLIIATHSPILMAYPGAQILLLDSGGITPVAYEDTEHYRLTKLFLSDPRRMLRHLLEED